MDGNSERLEHISFFSSHLHLKQNSPSLPPASRQLDGVGGARKEASARARRVQLSPRQHHRRTTMAPRLPAPTEGAESHRVWEIKTLGQEKKYPDDKKAKEMLEKTAWQVQPIMKARGWRVAELLEMKPEVRGWEGGGGGGGGVTEQRERAVFASI